MAQTPPHLAPQADRIEVALQRWGYVVTRHRWWALALSIALTGFLMSWLPGLTIDNSLEGLLLPDDPTSISYRAFRSQFDRDDRVVIGILPGDVFSVEFLEKLRDFHIALEEEVPYVEKVTSLFNARQARGDEGTLVIEDFLEGWLDEWPENPSTEGLRERVFSNSLYVNLLVSEDAQLTTVTLKPFTYSTLRDGSPLSGFEGDEESLPEMDLLTPAEADRLMAAVHRVVSRFEGPDFRVYMGGALVVSDHINRAMEKDSRSFLSLCVLVMFGLLLMLFRRLSGAVLPLLVMMLSLISSLGIMVALGIPATTSVQTLPILLLAVGICDAVHILTIVYQRLAAGDAKPDAIAYALGHSGLAVVMTSLTTAAGLMSFLTAKMAPVVQLGVIAPIGVSMALVYTLVLLPALLAICPLKPLTKQGGKPGGGLARLLVRVGDLSVAHPKAVIGAAVCVAVVSVAGALQAQFSHNALLWFDENDRLRVSTEQLNEHLRGPLSIEVVLDTGRPNALHDPEVLRRIEAAGRWAEGFSDGHVFVGKSLSMVDLVKETHQALHEGQDAFRRVPDRSEVVAQELLLFESGASEDLSEVVDSQASVARLSLRAPMVAATLYGPFLLRLEEGISEIVGDEMKVSITGMTPVITTTLSAVMQSMARSYLFAVAIIIPIMILLLRDVRLGLISMVPNVIPILSVLGIMGWARLPLDYTTIMVGAIVIGVSVDDTIHFMHKFRMYYIKTGDRAAAIRQTLATTGAALLFTTLVLAGGFFVITTSSLVPTRNFGFLAAIACLVAFVSDVLLGPALMTLCVPARRESPSSPTETSVALS